MRVVHFTDPGCPWAWSASPAQAVLRWRFGDGLDERLVMIGLTEEREQYAARGYTPLSRSRSVERFRRYGMPVTADLKPAISATSAACRTVVAARLRSPGRELAVLRALQVAQFTTPMLLDDRDDLAAALDGVRGVDGEALVGAIDDRDVREAYEDDRAAARTAADSPTEAQERAAATDGPVRYTAPSLVFEHDGRRMEAGGFQPWEAYDVVVANLDPSLPRRLHPDDPAAVLDANPDGLTTQEVAAIMCPRDERPDRAGAEHALLGLVADGRAERLPAGDDALWRSTG